MNYCYLPNLEASYNSVSWHSGFFNPIKYLSFVPNIKQKKKKYISQSGWTDTSAFCFTSSPKAHSHLPFVPCPYDVTFCFNKGYRLSLHVLSIAKFQLHVGCVWAFFVCQFYTSQVALNSIRCSTRHPQKCRIHTRPAIERLTLDLLKISYPYQWSIQSLLRDIVM